MMPSPHPLRSPLSVADESGDARKPALLAAYDLACLAWPLYPRYVPRTALEGAAINGVMDQDPREIGYDVAALCEIDLLPDPSAPSRLAGPLRNLPDEARDPGGHERLPELIAMAQAITLCLAPLAVELAASGEAPGALRDPASCGIRAARQALSVVHARHREADPSYHDDGRTLVVSYLGNGVRRDWPRELRDDWNFLVYVEQDCDAPEGMLVHDDMPLRCFEDLEEAKRYAILQTDWSGWLAGSGGRGAVDDDGHQADRHMRPAYLLDLVDRIAAYDGRDVQPAVFSMPSGPHSSRPMRTVIVPRAQRGTVQATLSAAA